MEKVVFNLLQDGQQLCFTPQNISEFWAVASRPIEKNGLGLSTSLVLAAISEIERVFFLLPDSLLVYEEWKSLVTQHKVVGKQVHDARLAAMARVYVVEKILIFNTVDFRRYRGIAGVSPGEI